MRGLVSLLCGRTATEPDRCVTFMSRCYRMTNGSKGKMERSALSVLSVQSTSIKDLERQSATISV